jgi:hypothetical protein
MKCVHIYIFKEKKKALPNYLQISAGPDFFPSSAWTITTKKKKNRNLNLSISAAISSRLTHNCNYTKKRCAITF